MASPSNTGRKTKSRKTTAITSRSAASNGLHRFSLHSEERANARARSTLMPKVAAATHGAAAVATSPVAQDPETAAYGYLQRALKSADMPEFSDPQRDGSTSEFLRLGTETVALTNTRTVKFRQTVFDAGARWLDCSLQNGIANWAQANPSAPPGASPVGRRSAPASQRFDRSHGVNVGPVGQDG
jgi:hypothetical protein